MKYEELPILTKEAVRKIRKLREIDYDRWVVMYDALCDDEAIDEDDIVNVIEAAINGVRISIFPKYWMRVLAAFKMFSDEVKNEMMPYLLGGKW